jgi:hypothetical protein
VAIPPDNFSKLTVPPSTLHPDDPPIIPATRPPPKLTMPCDMPLADFAGALACLAILAVGLLHACEWLPPQLTLRHSVVGSNLDQGTPFSPLVLRTCRLGNLLTRPVGLQDTYSYS